MTYPLELISIDLLCLIDKEQLVKHNDCANMVVIRGFETHFEASNKIASRWFQTYMLNNKVTH